MKRLFLPLFLLVAGSLGVLAAPVPLDAIGLNRTINIVSHVDVVGPIGSVGSGGEFSGTVSGTDFSYTTSFWCVDSQLTTQLGQTGTAHLHLLSDIPDPNIRYGNNATTWTNNTNVGLDSVTASQDRYAMAAWLVSQYAGADHNEDLNIQKAIWTVMHNTTGSAGYSYSGETEVLDWITQAYNSLTNGDKVDLTKWAVVTWAVDGPARQTFLVQVVPEPGFYAALALGLFGVFFYTWRRRQSVEGEQNAA